MHIDTFRQDAVVEDDELLVRIFAELVKGVEELLTIDFGLVDISTILAGDVQHVVTTLTQIVHNAGLEQQSTHDLAGRRRHEDLRRFVQQAGVYDVQQHGAVACSGSSTFSRVMSIVSTADRRGECLLPEPVQEQRRPTETQNHRSVLFMPRFVVGNRLGVAVKSMQHQMSCWQQRHNKMITLHSIMRFIKTL